MACNLTNPNSGPPTLVPYTTDVVATSSLQPTLGFATIVPGQEAQPTAIGLEAQVEVQLHNMMNQVEADRLMFHIDNLVGFHTRHTYSTTSSAGQGIGAAYTYIMNQLLQIRTAAPEHFAVFPYGHPYEISATSEQSTRHNIVAYLRGMDIGAGTIIIGAHYDSRTDDGTDSTSYAPGADDNGSGVAALLELARILSRYPQRSTIMFVFFSGEEQGRLGSRAFVKDYVNNTLQPYDTFMINLDTIGSWNASDGSINDTTIRVYSPGPNDSPSRQLARTLDFIAHNHNLNLDIKLEDGLDRDGRWGDQQSFSDAGYPAIRFIEALEDHYNRESRDTIDGVEASYLVNSTQTVLGVVLSLAGGPRPPSNIALRDNADGTASLVWEIVPEAERYVVALRRASSLGVNNHFVVTENTTTWNGWNDYEAVSIGAIDGNGLIGPLSLERRIQ